MMDCNEARDLLDAYADNMLGLADTARIGRHAILVTGEVSAVGRGGRGVAARGGRGDFARGYANIRLCGVASFGFPNISDVLA